MCINPSPKLDGPYRRNGSATTATTTNKSRADTDHSCGSSNNQTNQSSTNTALRRMTPLILSGYLLNTLVYFAIVYVPITSSFGVTFVPYPEYCRMTSTEYESEDDSSTNNTCTRRDLFAFQAVSFFNLTYLGLLGTYTFFFSKRRSVWWGSSEKKNGTSLSSSSSSSFSSTEVLPPTTHGRYFGKISEAEWINAGIVIFQGWDFVASFFFEEHCTIVMMMHHLLAFICGFFCLVYEVAPYYAVYFGGVSEFSSIFLCIAQIFEFYPLSSLVSLDSPLSFLLPNIVTLSQAAFVVTFFAFRIVGWAFMSYKFMLDGLFIIKNRLCMMHSPGSEWFLWYLLTTSGLLGALQVFWLKEIIHKVLEM